MTAATASPRWRPLFVAAGVFILIGGPLHPKGSTLEMLQNPAWVPAHTLLLAGFVCLLAGLLDYRRRLAGGDALRRWATFAVAGTVLQVVEMAVHDLAVVDAGHLAAGAPTPVLSTHLALAATCYPVFGAAMIVFIVAGARRRALGSFWIAWIGVVGAIGHGLSAPLTVVAQLPWAPALFAVLVGLAVWLVLAGLWPIRVPVADAPRGAPVRG